MSITITGATELAARLTSASGRIERPLRRALSQTGTEVKNRMKSIAPRKDGDLARAITMKSGGTKWRRSVYIGPETSRITPEPGDHRGAAAQRYPVYQEYGTARMRAQPFVAQSLDGAAERLAARLNSVIPELL